VLGKQASSPNDHFHWAELLLVNPGLTAQYVLEIADGVWECRCGNTPDFEGFDPCDELGRIVQPVLGPWDGSLHLCSRCGRIISGDTLEVLGYASIEVIEKNDDYRWIPFS